jgi:hypothetical protein
MSFYYVYPPSLGYPYTHVPQTFPEHHWPLEHSRNKVGHALHDFFVAEPGSENHLPRADIRETPDKYSIDIELPGLEKIDKTAIKWTHAWALTVCTDIDRPDIKEGEAQSNPSKPFLLTVYC